MEGGVAHRPDERCGTGSETRQRSSLPREHGREAFVDERDAAQRVARLLMTEPRASRSPLAAEAGVGSGVSLQRVFAEPADQQIIAESPFERVVARVADERVLSVAAGQQVVTRLAEQGVVTRSAIERVVAAPPFERVIPRAAVERIFARTTQQPVLAVAPRQAARFRECFAQRGNLPTEYGTRSSPHLQVGFNLSHSRVLTIASLAGNFVHRPSLIVGLGISTHTVKGFEHAKGKATGKNSDFLGGARRFLNSAWCRRNCYWLHRINHRPRRILDFHLRQEPKILL